MQFPISAVLGLAYGLSEAGLGLLKRSRDDSVDADDASLRMLWITIVLAVTAGIVASYRAPGGGIASRGVVLGRLRAVRAGPGAALVFHRLPGPVLHRERGHPFRPRDHRHGAVSRIRHPPTPARCWRSSGLALCIANWVSLARRVLPILWAFSRRMSIEESALAERARHALHQLHAAARSAWRLSSIDGAPTRRGGPPGVTRSRRAEIVPLRDD